MKAIEVKQNGGPETVAYADVAAPEPGAGQLQVTVGTAGLNYPRLSSRVLRSETGGGPRDEFRDAIAPLVSHLDQAFGVD
jgi:NADPH:quinone reductase-like Zn-dependent oxidoreductase